MKATIEEINSVQRRIKVSIPSEDVDKTFTDVLNAIRRKANIKGFRQGKAPLGLIKKFYADSMSSDVREKLIKSSLFKSIDENKLHPIASPYIEKVGEPTEGQEFSYDALIDIYPAIDLAEKYKDIDLVLEKASWDETDIERELHHLVAENAKRKPAELKDPVVKAGLQVVFNARASQNGDPQPQMSQDNATALIGHKQILPEIEDGLMGMGLGDIKTIQIDRTIGGEAPVRFDVELNVLELHEVDLPTLNDDFAKDIGHESMAEMRAHVEKQLQSSCDQKNQSELETKLLTALREKIAFQVPPSVIENFVDNLIDGMRFEGDKQRAAARQNPDVRKGLRRPAQIKAHNSMLLQELIAKEAIAVTEEEVAERLNTLFPEALKKREYAGILPQLKQNLRENLLFDKALKKLVSYAKVKEVPVKLWSSR